MNNVGFVNDANDLVSSLKKESITIPQTNDDNGESSKVGWEKKRDSWGKSIEFLMSCIAMSVGLGNVWRFPFSALENGGGAFLLPYLVVLFTIGRPLYYMEMVVGQFSGRNAVDLYDMVPFFRGSGVGQLLSTFLLSTYYASIMALVGRYLWESLESQLPWTKCKKEWLNCIDSAKQTNDNDFVTIFNTSTNRTIDNSKFISSSEYYFMKDVLMESENINDGIGIPILNLSLFLLFAWVVIAAVLVKGIRSSGKASYFLALFPYVIMLVLLVRALTLEGAWNGILYFIKPRWDKILEPSVWYAAVVQCFFSLCVGFGAIMMFSSFNKFDHNIYRDAYIVTSLDTVTSIIAGCTIFGILGHLAHELGTDDIGSVVNGGTGLAFISYPEAIARFDFAPQMFSILFFFMLFVLGIGSNIAMCTCIITILRDKFKSLKAWQAAIGLSVVGFLIGLPYVTPGGQQMLNLVDFYGVSFVVFTLVIGEIVAICWVYGVNRLCRDIEFMMNIKTGLYWRVCWGILTPILMTTILIYTFVSYTPLTYKGQLYPDWANGLGWTISAIGIAQLPIWAGIAVLKNFNSNIGNPFKPSSNWGPRNPKLFEEYQKFVASYEEQQRLLPRGNIFVRVKRHIFG